MRHPAASATTDSATDETIIAKEPAHIIGIDTEYPERMPNRDALRDPPSILRDRSGANTGTNPAAADSEGTARAKIMKNAGITADKRANGRMEEPFLIRVPIAYAKDPKKRDPARAVSRDSMKHAV
jgi:hypothetical protein